MDSNNIKYNNINISDTESILSYPILSYLKYYMSD